MPRARVSTATAAKAGDRARVRAPKVRSCQSVSKGCLLGRRIGVGPFSLRRSRPPNGLLPRDWTPAAWRDTRLAMKPTPQLLVALLVSAPVVAGPATSPGL